MAAFVFSLLPHCWDHSWCISFLISLVPFCRALRLWDAGRCHLFMQYSAHMPSLISISHFINSHSSDMIHLPFHTGLSPPQPFTPPIQSPCLSCSAVLIPGEDQATEEAAVLNGCHDDHKTNSSKVSGLLLAEANTQDGKWLIFYFVAWCMSIKILGHDELLWLHFVRPTNKKKDSKLVQRNRTPWVPV